jgi:hypothetical protein
MTNLAIPERKLVSGWKSLLLPMAVCGLLDWAIFGERSNRFISQSIPDFSICFDVECDRK